jgi:hypothetical protein
MVRGKQRLSSGAYEETCKTLVVIAGGSQDWGSLIAKTLSESVG